jgi:HlyD family secretion protein
MSMSLSRKAAMAGVATATGVFLLWFVLKPAPVLVELDTVRSRTLTVLVEEQGSTRARDPFVVATPIAGRLLRSELDAGDHVEQGQVLARIALPPEDGRQEAVLKANLVAAEAREAAARAALMEAESAYARATNEEQRRNELAKNSLTSAEELEYYRQVKDSAEARLLSMQASLQAARAEVESARSLLMGITYENDSAIQQVAAPIAGTIYRIYEESERVVQAGTPLIALSNDDSLEIVIDLLTQEAVKVQAGAPVNITGWGGDEVLQAVVRRVEPEAFTKISSLGVEEQRVNVIADFTSDNGGLGAGYRIDAGIVVWEADEVLTIPASAIFQRAGTWYAFVAEEGVARLRELQLGQRSRDHAQVLGGVSAGEQVVAFPTAVVGDGVSIKAQALP